MAASETLSNDIIKAQQEAEHKRNFDRSQAATLQKKNQPSIGQRAAGGAVKAAGSGMNLLGDAANAVPVVGGLAGTPLKALGGGLKKAGGAIGGSSVANNPVNDVTENMLPGAASINTMMDTNLPLLLRLMVAGKELTKPSFMLLWPFFGPLHFIFGVGALLARNVQGTKADGERASDEDIKMDDTGKLSVTLAGGILFVEGLLVIALFGSLSS